MLQAHEFADTFPLMDEESPEWRSFVEDIRANGLRFPILTYEGKVLDGRNRQRACEVAGVQPRYEEFEGTKQEAARLQAAQFSTSANLYRRHLNPGQFAVSVAKNDVLMAQFTTRAREAQNKTRNENLAKTDTCLPVGQTSSSQGDKASELFSKVKRVSDDQNVATQMASAAGISRPTAQAAITFVRAAESGGTDKKPVEKGPSAGLWKPAPQVKRAFERGTLPIEAAAKLVP